MYYGYIAQPTKVYIRGFDARAEQVQWAKHHKSDGLYSYQTHGIYADGIPSIKWLFSNPEDAMIFTLKFK